LEKKDLSLIQNDKSQSDRIYFLLRRQLDVVGVICRIESSFDRWSMGNFEYFILDHSVVACESLSSTGSKGPKPGSSH